MKVSLIAVMLVLNAYISWAQSIEVVSSFKPKSSGEWEFVDFVKLDSEACISISKERTENKEPKDPYLYWHITSLDKNLNPVDSKKVHFASKNFQFERIVNTEESAFFLFSGNKPFQKNNLEIHTLSFPDLRVSKLSCQVKSANIKGAKAIGNTLIISGKTARGSQGIFKINTVSGDVEEIDLTKFDLGYGLKIEVKRLEPVNNGKTMAVHIEATNQGREVSSYLLHLDETKQESTPIQVSLENGAYPLDFHSVFLDENDFAIIGTYGLEEQIIAGTFFQRHNGTTQATSMQDFNSLEEHVDFVNRSIYQNKHIKENKYQGIVYETKKTDDNIFLTIQAYYRVKEIVTETNPWSHLPGQYRTKSHSIKNYVTTHLIGICFDLQGSTLWRQVLRFEVLPNETLYSTYSPTLTDPTGLMLLEPLPFKKTHMPFLPDLSPILVSATGMQKFDSLRESQDDKISYPNEFQNWHNGYGLRLVRRYCFGAETDDEIKNCGLLIEKIRLSDLDPGFPRK